MERVENKKRVLITGGSRGIGWATAKALSQEYRVAVTATSLQSLTHLSQYPLISGIAYEFGHQTDMPSLWQHATDLLEGEPDILINNAAMTDDTLMIRMKHDSWQKVIDVNLTAVFKLSQLAVKSMMKKRWGRVINMSSVVAQCGNVGQANYIAAKAGIEGLTKAMALETAKRGITVNAVSPGFIATKMTEGLGDELISQIIQKIPMGRVGQVNDVVGLIEYLISENASYMTGQVLHVNGGLHLA